MNSVIWNLTLMTVLLLLMIQAICAPNPEEKQEDTFADILSHHRAWIHKSPRPIIAVKKPEHQGQNSEDEEDGQKSEPTPESVDQNRPECSNNRRSKLRRRSEHRSPISSGSEHGSSSEHPGGGLPEITEYQNSESEHDSSMAEFKGYSTPSGSEANGISESERKRRQEEFVRQWYDPNPYWETEDEWVDNERSDSSSESEEEEEKKNRNHFTWRSR